VVLKVVTLASKVK